MWSTDRRWTTTSALVLVAGLLAACTPGIQAGDVATTFTGVREAQVLSPTAVKLLWQRSEGFDFYDVYGDFSDTPLATQVTESALIEGLTPNTTYVFKVIGRGPAGQAGTPREIKVTTWPRFEGIVSATKNTDDHIVLTWDYPYTVDEFLVYYAEETAPTQQSTVDWSNHQHRTSGQSVTFKNLKGSVNYYFTVHARYRGEEFERPTKTLMAATTSSFPKPVYDLPKITIGSLPQMSVQPVVNATFKEEKYTSILYKGDTVASDPLIGKGWLTFHPSLNLPLGRVDNITLKVTYSEGSLTETLTVPGLSTYLKGVTPFLDLPPQASVESGQGFMGRAVAAGDFNCDGYDDLAVGLPEATLANLGVSKPRAGAVYVYYGGFQKQYPDGSVRYVLKTEHEVPGLLPLRYPAIPGKDPQIITFDDLHEESQFGFSLFGRANLNGDVGGTGLPCQDLIVGAPVAHNPSRNRRDGAAFVFFGSPDGLKAPTTLAALPSNAATCDGRFQGASCTAVRLFEDYSLWPSDSTGPLGGVFDINSTTSGSSERNRFGESVASIGDFDGDGYEDLLIGAPNGRWDGRPSSVTGNVDPGNPGFVAMYFGSKFGLGAIRTTASSAANETFRFIKIYPPMPKDGMKFGASISGGVDVDGRELIDIGGGVRHGGADFVVGAPAFNYSVLSNSQRAVGGGVFPLTTVANNWTSQGAYIKPFEAGWLDFGGVGASVRYGIVTGRITGAAFLYFGRTGDIGDSANSVLDNFWSCGERAMAGKTTHYSCLNNRANYRVLFPRQPLYNGTAYGFGSAVMLVGNRQARNPADNDLWCPPATPGDFGDPTPVANCTPNRADANGDGMGDVIVVAPNGNGNRGEVWQFFGNQGRIFEGGGTNDQFSGNITLEETYNMAAVCTNFASASIGSRTTDKRACAPTVVRSDTITAGALVGSRATGIDRGDLTGNNLQDVAIGAANDSTLASGSGAVYVFSSSLGAGMTSSFKKVYGATLNQNDSLGWSVAIGDFDVGPPGLINDIAVGAPNDDANRAAGGSVRIFLSGAATLPAIKSSIDHTLFDHYGSYQNYDYGTARIVGDINGDGYEDAVAHVSSFAEDGGIIFDAVVFFGSSMGLVTTTFCLQNQSRVFKSGSGGAMNCYPSKSHPSGITAQDVVLPQLLTQPVGSTKRWAELSYRAGDVNGDGYADVVFADPVGPQIAVYFGTRGGLQDLVAPSFTPAINDPQMVTKKFTFSLLDSISGSGSYYDAANRPDSIQYHQHHIPIISGDFNGDGFSDIVVSNPDYYSPTMNLPILTDAPAMCYTTDDSAPSCPGNGQYAKWSCDPADQGNSECISGSGVRSHGAVVIFYGGPGGLQTPSTTGNGNDNSINLNASTTAFKNLYNSESVAGNRSCVNGVCVPGYLRNPIWLNIPYGYRRLDHQFGSSVVAMDADGDGADDLVISAPGYEHPACWHEEYEDDGSEPENRIRNTGRVYIFYGSKQHGLQADVETSYYQPLPAWSHLECKVDDAETALAVNEGKLRALQPPLGIEIWNPLTDSDKFASDARETAAGFTSTSHYRNRLNRSFGMRIENVGDVNKDGFEDLIVSAPYENVLDAAGTVRLGVGAMYVFYGPLCGTDNMADVHKVAQINTRVNKANTFLNDLPGINPVADCQGKTLGPQRFFVQDATFGDRYGFTLTGGRATKNSAGEPVLTSDVNLDGYGDVLVGSFNYADPVEGTAKSGRGVVYFGSPGGLYTDDFPSAVIETLEGQKVKPYVINPPRAILNSMFFRGNASGGDVNGDGANDFLVPSFTYNGEDGFKGINLGTFFMFY